MISFLSFYFSDYMQKKNNYYWYLHYYTHEKVSYEYNKKITLI